MELGKNSKIAIVCRPGPDNGPFSAQALATFREGLQMNGQDISGIYAVSGSCSTALLGCINEEEMLCKILFNLTPEDVVGDTTDLKSVVRLLKKIEERDSLLPRSVSDFREMKQAKILVQRLKDGHVFSNLPLLRLVEKYCLPVIDKIFGPEAILMKIGAVDFLTAQSVIFSNKIPEHKDLICIGTIGSMCLIPWFQSPTIDSPIEKKLVDRVHPKFNSILLMDGGYKTGLLLEEAVREPVGYDAIFIIDIHDLQFEDINLAIPYNIATRLIRTISTLTVTNDQLVLSLVERINEGVSIRNKIAEVKNKLLEIKRASGYSQNVEDVTKQVEELIDQMDHGRLRLADKYTQQIGKISNPDLAIPFDFTNFNQATVTHLMRAGHNAALKMLKQLGLNIQGIPLIRP